MGNDTIFVIRVDSTVCELDFCQAGHFDDFPMVANYVADVLGLSIDTKTDGPSERLCSFQNSHLVLVNDPTGTVLKTKSWSDLHLLQRLVDQYLKNQKMIDERKPTPN